MLNRINNNSQHITKHTRYPIQPILFIITINISMWDRNISFHLIEIFKLMIWDQKSLMVIWEDELLGERLLGEGYFC